MHSVVPARHREGIITVTAGQRDGISTVAVGHRKGISMVPARQREGNKNLGGSACARAALKEAVRGVGGGDDDHDVSGQPTSGHAAAGLENASLLTSPSAPCHLSLLLRHARPCSSRCLCMAALTGTPAAPMSYLGGGFNTACRGTACHLANSRDMCEPCDCVVGFRTHVGHALVGGQLGSICSSKRRGRGFCACHGWAAAAVVMTPRSCDLRQTLLLDHCAIPHCASDVGRSVACGGCSTRGRHGAPQTRSCNGAVTVRHKHDLPVQARRSLGSLALAPHTLTSHQVSRTQNQKSRHPHSQTAPMNMFWAA